MKQFVIKITAFSILLFGLGKCLDKFITIGLKQSETKLFNKITKINQGKINADIIINGSSKALVQVDPHIIDSVLEMNSYNLGLDGTPFIPQKALYELYRIKNIKPKIIIQIVSNGTLRDLKLGFKSPIKFAPYLNVEKIKKNMKLTGSFDYTDYNIPMSRYLGKPLEIIIGGFSFFNVQLFKSKEKKGYLPNDKHWIESSDKDIESSKELINIKNQKEIEKFIGIDNISSKSFESFLSQCNKENIIVFLVYPPIYSESFSTIRNVDYYKKTAKVYNAFFLDYSQDSTLSFNKKYFYNSQHLNVSGATIFTKKLAEGIKVRTHNNAYKSLGNK